MSLVMSITSQPQPAARPQCRRRECRHDREQQQVRDNAQHRAAEGAVTVGDRRTGRHKERADPAHYEQHRDGHRRVSQGEMCVGSPGSAHQFPVTG